MSLAMMTDEQVKMCEQILSEAGFGAMETAVGNLPLARLDLDVNIHGIFARVTLKQAFVNKHDQPLEATYIFPMPDRGAVTGFRMSVNNRVIEGLIKERGEARRDYDKAISQGKTASIVEEDRPDTFTMRVGNIPKGATAEVELNLSVPLVYRSGEATFRFPLVVAPRYIPGSALDGESAGSGTSSDTDAVPDASRITPPVLLPGFLSKVQLNIECSIHGGGLPISDIRSSLHTVTRGESGEKTILRVTPGERVNRDFILRFKVSKKEVASSLMVVPDAEGEGSTFMLSVIPPQDAADIRRPRDIVFVLDRSGSMSGWKMVAARRAIGRMVDTLDGGDRFDVLAFDTSVDSFVTDTFGQKGEKSLSFGEKVRRFWEGSPEEQVRAVEATNRARYKAIEWLTKIDARGGTEMAEPIEMALKALGGGGTTRDRYVVLVTDGQVGNEDQILKHTTKHNKGAHIFTVGIDQAVNEGFLHRLASLTGGRCELVESEDRLDEIMDNVHQMIETPVLREVGVKIDGGTIHADTMVPNGAVTLFAGAPLTFMGRLTGKGPFRAMMRAATPGGVLVEEETKGTPVNDSDLGAIWARAQLISLEDRLAAEIYSSAGVREQIIATSLKHKVLCRFTAFVAVDHESKVEGPLHQVTQAVEILEGWAPGMPSPPPASMPRIQASFGIGQAMSGAPMPSAPPPPSREMSKRKESAFDMMDEMAMADMADMEAEYGAPQRSNVLYSSAPEPVTRDIVLGETSKGSTFRSDVLILAELLLLLLTGKLDWKPEALAGLPIAFQTVLTSVLELSMSNPHHLLRDLTTAAGTVGMNLKVKPALDTARELSRTAPIAPALAVSVVCQLTRRVIDGELTGEDQILDARIQK